MKANMLKRVIASVLLGIMMLSLCSCGKEEIETVKPMEKEEVATLSFEFIGGQDVMPIAGFYGPMTYLEGGDGRTAPNHYTDEIFSLISETGVNLLVYANADYQKAKDYVIKELELGEKYNLGIYVYDSKICNPDAKAPISIEDLDAALTKYCDYPAFCGAYVIDEPQTPFFTDNELRYVSRFAPVYQKLKELGVVGSTNLYPLVNETDYEKYIQYIEEFCSTCDPSYLCFDYYVWDVGKTKEMYFQNLSIIKHYAEEYNIPFWSYVQAGAQWNDSKIKFDTDGLYPSEGELFWNVNTSLACGAKGIAYFPLIQPWHFAYAETEEFDFQRNGLLGAMGNKTQWYYYAQNANKQIAAVDTVLMNANSKGVIATGKAAKKDLEKYEFLMEGTSWRELNSVDGNTLIGCFNYEGKTALYVTNYETEYAQKVTLHLQDTYQVSVTQNAETSNIKTDTLVLDMKAGEGALVVFE